MEQKQPKIVQKLLLRTFILLVSVAAVFLGIQYLMAWREDPDSGTSDTAGMIAAIEVLPDGQQAILYDSAGKKIPSPDYVTGKSDRDLTWRPDGNRLFFSSDRKEGAYHLFRWNPGSGSVDQKSTGTLSKFDPSFPTVVDQADAKSVEAAGRNVLITQGGFVLEFDIKKSTSQQLMPPSGGVTVGAEEESGNSGQFDSVYKKLGNAFRSARWAKDQNYIAAIMKRDEGEILIIQKLASSDPAELLPRPVMAADRIEMDIDPKTGSVVFSVLSFQFVDLENIHESNIKNGRAVKPFIHGVFALDPAVAGQEALVPIAVSNDSKRAFGPICMSPKGDQLAITTGSYDGDTFLPAALAVLPLREGGIQSGASVIGGQIYEASWHPNGETITYIKREAGERAIYKINRDGSGETRVSTSGNYMFPKFSPQSK